jgi:hypothetical protein
VLVEVWLRPLQLQAEPLPQVELVPLAPQVELGPLLVQEPLLAPLRELARLQVPQEPQVRLQA